MEANKILYANILDIVFEGRNKLYGAYELRKFYNRRLSKSMIIAAGLLLVTFMGIIVANYVNTKTNVPNIDIREHELGQIEQEVQLPPVPPPVQPPRKIKQDQFNSFKIVDDNLVKPDEKINEIEDDAVISTKTVVSNNTSQIVQTPVEDNRSQVIEVPTKKSDEDLPFNKVEVEAGFPGGNAAWLRYLKNNLDANTPVENGVPEGTYQVIVRFIVSRNGSISDVVAETSFGYGMEAEAIKIIKQGPNWTPALQNGQNVKAYRRQPITFMVNEVQ